MLISALISQGLRWSRSIHVDQSVPFVRSQANIGGLASFDMGQTPYHENLLSMAFDTRDMIQPTLVPTHSPRSDHSFTHSEPFRAMVFSTIVLCWRVYHGAHVLYNSMSVNDP